MFMSYFIPEIKADDDAGLAEYLNEVEKNIPGGTVANNEWQSPTNPWTSTYWDVERKGINEYFRRYNVSKTVAWGEVRLAELLVRLKDSPLILGTKLTAGGHIILITGGANEEFTINDPYGDYGTGYKNQNGHGVKYSADLIEATAGATTGKLGTYRIMWAV
jgi:hypothetical protein